MQKIPAKAISYSSSKRSHDDVKYIVIHYTANAGDTAINNGNFYHNVNERQAGAHFFIDQRGNIVNSIDMNRAAWAVGGNLYSDVKETGGGKLYGTVTNWNSVSIELCDLVTKDPSSYMISAVKQCIKYIRKSCKNANTVVRHFDVNGKYCPRSMMKDDLWKQFLDDIGESKSYMASPKVNPITKEFKVQIIVPILTVRKTGKTSGTAVGEVKKGDVYTIVESKDGWGKLKSGAGWININTKYVRMV